MAVSLEGDDNVDDEEIETNSDFSGKVTALATEIKSLKRVILLPKFIRLSCRSTKWFC